MTRKWLIRRKTKQGTNQPTVFDNVVVVGALTCSALLQSVCYLKAAWRNGQQNLFWELMLYEFELDINVGQATKNICCVKGEDIVDDSRVKKNGWRNFALAAKNLNDEAWLSWPKTMDSNAVPQAIEAKPVCNTWKVSGDIGISQCEHCDSWLTQPPI